MKLSVNYIEIMNFDGFINYSNAGIVYIGSIIKETEKIFTLLESTNASEEKSGKNGAKLCLAHGVLSSFSLHQLAGIKL